MLAGMVIEAGSARAAGGRGVYGLRCSRLSHAACLPWAIAAIAAARGPLCSHAWDSEAAAAGARGCPLPSPRRAGFRDGSLSRRGTARQNHARIRTTDPAANNGPSSKQRPLRSLRRLTLDISNAWWRFYKHRDAWNSVFTLPRPPRTL